MAQLHDSRRTEATHPGFLVNTRWSVVLAGKDDSASHEALKWLCERYWLPLYALLRSHGCTAGEAKALLCRFYDDFLSPNVAPETNVERRGIRSFLLSCLKPYVTLKATLADQQALGRGFEWARPEGPGVEARIEAELSESRLPEAAFDRQWAVSLMDYALERLRAECEADGRNGRFEVLKPCLAEAMEEDSEAELAAKLKVSVTAVKLVIQRLRRRYREIVREEVAETVASAEEVEPELRHLLTALRS